MDKPEERPVPSSVYYPALDLLILGPESWEQIWREHDERKRLEDELHG